MKGLGRAPSTLRILATTLATFGTMAEAQSPTPRTSPPTGAPAAATPAGAQNTDASPEADRPNDAIVVTAQRRSEIARDVPITITSIDRSQIATANVTQLSDISRVTPGLRFDFQGPSVQPTIRGVGTAITTAGGGPNVGIYVDGFFQPNSYVNNFDLLNVRDIEVLKGPQGTLFGRNTTGGAILVGTADPSTDTGGEFRVRFGRFDEIRSQSYLTVGVTDRLAMDIEALYGYGQGFQRNVQNGDRTVGRHRTFSVRTGAKWRVTDDVSILLRFTHAEQSDPAAALTGAFQDKSGTAGFFDLVSPAGRAAYGRSSSDGQPLVYLYTPASALTTRPGEVNTPDRVRFKTRSDIAQATIEADLGFADLTSYTQYRFDRSAYDLDLDAVALPLFHLNQVTTDRTFGQELLLNSKPGTRFQYTVGANYFQYRDVWDIGAGFGGPIMPFGGSGVLTRSVAAYADATYRIGERLFLTAGARFSHDVVTDGFFRTNFSNTFYTGPDGRPVPVGNLPPETRIDVDALHNNSVTPRAVIRYKPNDTSSVYASYTRGFKAGILNVGGQSQQKVKPEKINAFEAGYKFDNRIVSLDLAGYYYDYKDLQVSSYQDGAAQIRNAASSEIYGLEAQASWRPTSRLRLNAGAAWTHARYKSFPNAPYYSYCDPVAPATPALVCGAYGPGSLTQATVDASGFKMQRAPDLTGNAGASYGLPLAGGRLTTSANLYYSSSFYFDPAEQFREKAYETLALRTEWTDRTRGFSAALFGDNVTGRRYRTEAIFNTLGIGAAWNSPATYGVEIGVKF